MPHFVRVALCLVLAVLCQPLLAAQETINLGSISGRLTDSQDAIVVGATVTVRQTETNVTSTAVSDKDGRFRFPDWRLGPYGKPLRVRLASLTAIAASRSARAPRSSCR